MERFMRITAENMSFVATSLRIIFGLTFMTSAILKFFPLEAFEIVMIKQLGVSWAWAPLFSRMLIISEFSLGALLIFGYRTTTMLYASFLLLLIFSAYLLHLVLTGQVDQNCGCFGEIIPMDAVSSLWKNAFLLAIALKLFLIRKYEVKWKFSLFAIIPALLFGVTTFLVSPLPSGNLDMPVELDFSIVEGLEQETEMDLSEGEKVIVIMHSTCIHCKQLATLLSSANPTDAARKMRMVIYGSEDMVEKFTSETGIDNFNYSRTEDRELFMAIGGTFPTILEVNDYRIISRWTGQNVNLDLLSKLLISNE